MGQTSLRASELPRRLSLEYSVRSREGHRHVPGRAEILHERERRSPLETNARDREGKSLTSGKLPIPPLDVDRSLLRVVVRR